MAALSCLLCFLQFSIQCIILINLQFEYYLFRTRSNLANNILAHVLYSFNNPYNNPFNNPKMNTYSAITHNEIFYI